MKGKKIVFKTIEKCEPYQVNGEYKDTKEVICVGGYVLDKYRGSAQIINKGRDVFNYALVDFYLVSYEDKLYHVLPTDIMRIIQ